MVKKTLSPTLIAFFWADEFYLSLCREHPKRWILQKPQVRTTSKRMQHNMELFLSSKLGHSLKRNVKLLGREQRSDFHHNRTTPLEACRFFFSSVSFSLASGSFDLSKASFQSKWQCAKSFENYVRVSSYIWMWRVPPSWLSGYKTLFHTCLICHFSRTQGCLA